MSVQMTIHMAVTLPTHPVVGPPALHFARWFPNDDADAIEWMLEDVVVRLSFQRTQNGIATQEPLENHVGVLAHRVSVLAEVEVTEALWDYIASIDANAIDRTGAMGAEYTAVGRRVFRSVVGCVNRLLSYAIGRGQYWMAELLADEENSENFFIASGAHWVQGSDGRKVRWRPDPVHRMTVALLPPNRFIHPEEWVTARAWMPSSRRVDVVNELLSASELLAGYGYSRSALAEAVSALEVCLYRFAASPNLLSPFDSARYSATSLKGVIEHLGFSTSVAFLLPTIFPASVVADDTLRICRAAIESRNNVLHRGARTLDVAVANDQIRAVRKLCSILTAHTMEATAVACP